LPSPLEQAISVGDILTYGGVGIVIVGAMRKPRPTESVANAKVAHVGA
jgi:hypothetical protein